MEGNFVGSFCGITLIGCQKFWGSKLKRGPNYKGVKII